MKFEKDPKAFVSFHLVDANKHYFLFDEPDFGALYENFIHNQLVREYKIKYWRTTAKTEVDFITELGKEIIAITVVQIHQYCGNVLQLGSKEGKSMIVMSKTAHNAFTQENRNTLSKYGELIIADIPTIEQVGGGSARCMMAEVFK